MKKKDYNKQETYNSLYNAGCTVFVSMGLVLTIFLSKSFVSMHLQNSLQSIIGSLCLNEKRIQEI